MGIKELKPIKNTDKILLLGFGKEGQDTYLALRKLFPKKELAIADQMEFSIFSSLKLYSNLIKKDKYLKLHLGKNYLKSLRNYNLIIKTPGIPLQTIKPFLKKKAEITSQTEIFFDNCKGKIIGITGTKGKGTTSSLIYKILKTKGMKVHLVGNIGKPVLQMLLKSNKKDIFVYELSSHQLQNLKKSPYIAVFLNIYPAHLDYYKNFIQYQKAKENITKWQTKKDFFIYNQDQRVLKKFAAKTKAKKISFGRNKIKNLEKIIPKKEIPLKGEFNLLNVMAAISAAQIFNIKTKDIKKSLRCFKPLPYRLEFVGKYKGIEFYNDSLATIPQATQVALESLGNKVKTLILGGSYVKGFDFEDLAKKILRSKIKTLIFLDRGVKNSKITETGKKIWDLIKKNTVKTPDVFFVSSMAEAVKRAYQNTKKGEICLLSPGAPSFNLFSSYKQRGDLFKKYVKVLGKK